MSDKGLNRRQFLLSTGAFGFISALSTGDSLSKEISDPGNNPVSDISHHPNVVRRRTDSGISMRHAIQQDEWSPQRGPLLTEWAKDVSPHNVLPEYPRPQMVRDRWMNLNGLWDYQITAKQAEQIPASWQGKIMVPYPIESALSGVMKPLMPDQRLWYHRQIIIPQDWKGSRILLHFGASDWKTTVFLNGRELGSHLGGYDAFTFDLSSAINGAGTQDIVVSVWDPTDSKWQMHGKQSLHPGGCSYTACSGIWQTVWLEPVSHSSIEHVQMVADLTSNSLKLTVSGYIGCDPMTLTATVYDDAEKLEEITGQAGETLSEAVKKNMVDFYHCTGSWFTTALMIPIKNPKLWTPASPFLYNLNVSLKSKTGETTDSVKSYFAMRSIAVGHDEKGNTRPMLNGKPILLCGALDQGYWPDGIYTAPTDAALKFDIEAAKKLGLNVVRKHVKIEPDRWYYWADKLGLMVMQDMPTGNEGDAITDLPRSPEAASQCEMEMKQLIKQHWNHPSIIGWIMFNEGWGQFDTLRFAKWAKELDPTRLIDEASGFPWHGGGDVADNHGGIPPKDPHRIGITSEDGGYGLSSPGHDWSNKVWTYRTYDSKTGGEMSGMIEDLHGKLPPVNDASRMWMTRKVRSMYRALWLNKDETGQSGDFFCQLIDVETECDGLLSYDRAVWKVDPSIIRAACDGQILVPSAGTIIPCALTQSVPWKYTTQDPGEGWIKPGYNDSEWKVGMSGFGAGIPHVHTPWTTDDIWLRKEFSLREKPIGAFLRIFHDEDVDVYINGVLACHDGGFLTCYDDFNILPDAIAALNVGNNEIAVHCHQTTGGQYIDVGLLTRAIQP